MKVKEQKQINKLLSQLILIESILCLSTAKHNQQLLSLTLSKT